MAIFAAAIGAAGAIGSAALASSGGGTSSGSSSSAPWVNQQPFLQDVWAQGQDYNARRQNAGPYTGSFYSPINGMQTGGATQANNFATGPGATLANGVAGAGGTLIGASTPFMGNANGVAANGINGVAPGLTTALSRAGMAGAQGIQGIIDKATSDQSPLLARGASEIMNSAPTQDAIKATNATIDQTLNTQTLPGLDRAAANGGSLNSSRAGMEDAMARIGAANTKAQADSGILNNAFNSGLSATTQANDTGLMAGQWAASGAMGNGLSSAVQDTQAKLAGNSQLGTAANMGFGAASEAPSIAGLNFNLGEGAGNVLQGDANNELANKFQRWNQQTWYPQQSLDAYAGLVENNNFGSSASYKQTAPGTSPFGAAAGTAMLLGNPGNSGGSWFGPNSIAGQAGSWLNNAWQNNFGTYAGTSGPVDGMVPWTDSMSGQVLGNTLMSQYG